MGRDNLGISTADFRAALKNGAHSFPGGYPLYFVMVDGAALCFDCAREERARIVYMARVDRLSALHWAPDDGWRVSMLDTNWEDPSLFCTHCDARIPSAYAEDAAIDAESNSAVSKG